MARGIAGLPDDQRGELDRMFGRVTELSRRIESNVAAIVQASRSAAQAGALAASFSRAASALSAFVEKLEDIPTKDPS